MQNLDANCLNCGSPLAGTYCSSCGQKRPHTDVTLREFLKETTEELTQWEGKVPQTLKTLLLRPGQLTRDFLEGRRKRWLPPLRVYLICSVVYFLGKPMFEAVTHRSAREMAKVSFSSPDGGTVTLTPEAREQIAQGLPARIFGVERLERAAVNSKELNREIDKAFPRAMFVLLPLFALLTRIAWGKRKLRYPAHLYAALHVHAAWFAAFTLSMIVTGFAPTPVAVAMGVVLLLYMAWYALVAFKRLFEESWTRTVLKSAAIGVVYGATASATALLLLGFVILTM